MEIGKSRSVNGLLRLLDDNVKNNMDNYVLDVCSSKFNKMESIDDINNFFGHSLNEYVDSLTEDERMILRSWTGYNFRNINAILRRNWNYDVNGRLTDDKNIYYRKLADLISKIIGKFQNPNLNFITYRGVSIDSFYSYGIRNLSDFTNLINNFIYEEGFASSSLLSESSYFNKDIGDGKKYNVEIRYMISSNFDDGALLIDNEMSYSVCQNEFLIDKNTLSKVVDVNINDNSVILTVVPIPKKIWDLVTYKDINSSRKK